MQTRKKVTEYEWNRIATNAAKDAHEQEFFSRRGVYVVEGVGVVYYDNNPFQLRRGQDPRETLISEFRDFLKRSNLEEKASAYWPEYGDLKDYTFAMVIEADEVTLEPIRRQLEQLVARLFRR